MYCCNEDVYKYLLAHSQNNRVCDRKTALICNSWNKFREKHKLNTNLTFHALRHHYASKCILLGIPQKYIAKLMGHSLTVMIEQVYQHIFPSAMEEYSNRLRDQMNELCNTKSNI
ncbi:MAG: tyrosine-type recombinase/integrase [Oscillospiraceae bacterium]